MWPVQCWPVTFLELSGTKKIASQNRNDHSGRKRARNRSAAEIARSVNVGFQTVVRVVWGNEIPLPPF